jgi:PAS domain S-box-containing protein
MEKSVRQFAHGLTRIYIASLSLIALIAIVSQIFIHTILEKGNSDSRVINMAGGQRMLSQKIIKTTLLIEREPDLKKRAKTANELRGLANTWNRVHEGLQFGDEGLGLPGNNSDEIRLLYQKIDPSFKTIFYQTGRVCRVALTDSLQLAEALQIMLANEPVFLKWMDAISHGYDVESSHRIAILQRTEYILFFITVLVLLLEGFFIFRPSVQRTAFYFEQLARSTRLANDLNTQLEEKTQEQQQAQNKLEDIFIQQRALIAKSKKNEEEILAKQKFITAVTQATPDMLYVFDLLEMRKIFTNKQISSVLGYSAEEIQDLKGEFLTELIHPDEMALVAGNHRRILQAKDGEVFMIEYRMRHKNGHYVWLLCQEVVFARDENGVPTQLMGIAQDITEKKKNLEALAASETKYRSMIENAEDIIHETDAKGYFTYVNPVTLRILGYSLEEFMEMRYWEIIKADYRREIISFYNQQLEEQSMIFYKEFPVISKDGKEIWLGQNAIFEFDNQHVKTVRVIARDITLLKLAEHKIKESEKRYRSVVENIAEIVFQTNAEGKWTFLNPAFATITGFSVEDSLGRLYTEFIFMEDQKLNMELFRPLIRQEKEYCRHQIRLMCKNGTFKWVEIFAQLTLDAKKRVHGISGTINDISERKEVEEALIQAKEHAEEIAVAKQYFLSTMSHEIRTPMNAVIGMTHLLLQENPRPDQVENLSILKFSADNLLVLINDILDYSKIEAGKITLEEVDFDLHELISSIEQGLAFKAEEKNLLLDVYIDPLLPEMFSGDPVRLGQVLNNLVSNAIKFTERGMVKIEALAGSSVDDFIEVHFSVTDTGIGIPPEKLDYIFESFTQASSDTTRRFGGTGLGLAITKRLLELQNSTIKVESEPGLGSRFSFCLLLQKSLTPQAGHIPAFTSKPLLELTNIKLLLVEDNEVNIAVATKFLFQWGIVPDCAIDGKVALEKIKTAQYDIVLMDLQMPELDGYEVTKLIRDIQEPYFQQLPIIALTASAMLDVRAKLQAIGMTDYITKPFNPGELYGKIAHYTNQGIMAEFTDDFNTDKRVVGSSHPVISYDSLAAISGDDKVFRQRLIDIYIRSFKNYKLAYQQAMRTKDESLLTEVTEKINPTLTILGAHSLIKELKASKEVLLSQGDDLADFTDFIERVENLCDEIIAQLAQVQS